MISVTAIVFSILLLLMLRTRTVLIALSLYLFLAFVLQIKTRFSKKIYYWLIIAVIGTAAIGIWTLLSIKSNIPSSSGIREHYFSRLLSSGTFYERLEFWKQSIYMTTDNFFNGVGLGNWINTYPKYGLHQFSDANIINGRMMVGTPHNDFLLVLSEIGIFGFLCYIGIFVSMLYQAYWLAKNEENSTDRKNASYLFFFIVCYLIVAFFDFPITRIEHQILLFVTFSIINAKYIKAKSIRKIAIPSRIFYLSSLILLMYSASVLVYRIKGEIHLYKALEAEKKSDITTALFEFNKAKTYCLSTDNFAIPLDWHIGRIQYNQGYFDESLNYFLDAYNVNPYNLVVNNDLGSAYIKNGETAYGIKHYKEALTISPNYEDARINLAATYFNHNEYEKAFETIVKCENNSENKSYKQILIPIVEKKLNITLIRINNQNLNNYLKSKIKTEADLLNLYFGYNKNILTFDEYIQSLIH
ncbi:O-antigen ligase family protein [Flavobacterium sp. AS60]|uniref:O-antigen ligase family protein n=1 Tax=Flavobacterium anseongense TaxID=2910677 RepID=UPI001F207871|nr:O-antigen ligase family protein [Flavobacterium sp. AS60]MCF6128511.1 O-antigen ligase family protein [Flavobacterium sp. AS60]